MRGGTAMHGLWWEFHTKTAHHPPATPPREDQKAIYNCGLFSTRW